MYNYEMVEIAVFLYITILTRHFQLFELFFHSSIITDVRHDVKTSRGTVTALSPVPLMITVITARAVSILGTYHWMRAGRLDLRGMVDICGLNKCKCSQSTREMIMGYAC